MSKPVIIVVDDDPQVLAAVRRDLRSQYGKEYLVISAGSGQEALAQASELQPDVILLDLTLPDIDNFMSVFPDEASALAQV